MDCSASAVRSRKGGSLASASAWAQLPPDALYGIVAALGLTAVTATLLAFRSLIQLIGGAFLVFLGVSIARTKASSSATAVGSFERPNLFVAYASTLALTLSNPVTVLSFIGILTGAGVGLNTTGAASLALFISGVFSGSMTWWLLLSTSASWIGAKLNAQHIRWINRGAGALLSGFGCWQLVYLALKR